MLNKLVGGDATAHSGYSIIGGRPVTRWHTRRSHLCLLAVRRGRGRGGSV